MSLLSFEKRKLTGTLLVALQFGLLFVLAALAIRRILQGVFPTGALVLAACCAALAAWTLRHNRLGNFNIRPMPKTGGTMVVTGPYRWIRHPMYTSVLLGAAALAWVSDSVALGWTAWSALALDLLMKSILEERWMREHHLGYARYRRESKRFVPWVF